MRFLVTGGAGFLGSLVVSRLLRSGHFVRVLDTFWFGRESLLIHAEAIESGLLELHRGDVRDLPTGILVGLDAVCHLAALSNDPTSDVAPQITDEINVAAVATLTAAMAQAGVETLVFASSASVYDGAHDLPSSPPHREYTEHTNLAPLGRYSLSKYAAEALLAADDRVKSIMFRFGTMGGVAPRMRFDLVVNAMVRDVILNGVIQIHGEGHASRPIIDVDDAAACVATALEFSERFRSGVPINVAAANVSISEIAEAVALEAVQLGIPVRIMHTDPPTRIRDYRIACDYLLDHVGFRAERPLAQTVNEVFTYSLDLGEQALREESRFENLRHLKQTGVIS